jgi:hypothetical protein
MRNYQIGLRGVALAAALAAASFSAHADTAIKAFFTFDNVAANSTANSALGSWASKLSFGNADVVQDVDAFGSYTGTFHWVDASATYGDVLIKSDADAVSGDKVLWNDHQPILVMFANPVNITRFSIAQDLSGNGNLQQNGSTLSFLDASGHVIAAADVFYTQGANPALTLQNAGAVHNVSAVLLARGVNYDNMYVNAVAVPEPESWAMFCGGLLLMGAMARRRLF